jgi:predicted nucleic acid-binding protein
VRVLVDTGPLVALLDPNDKEHARCRATLDQILPPLLTCWPVLTEAAWLLREDTHGLSRLLTGAEAGLFRILDLPQDALVQIERLRVRYRSLSPQLADLATVHLAQREGIQTVFTLDRRDFSVYRWKGRAPFHLLPELE